jgi:ribonuclease HI
MGPSLKGKKWMRLCCIKIVFAGNLTTIQARAFETITSNIRMKIEAMAKTLRWLEKENKTSATIITDSQNPLK